MSKKRRKQRQKPKFPWLLLASGGLLIILAVFLLLSWQSSDEGGTPAIAVDQERIDFGTVKFNTPLTFTIKVTNTGDGTLRFTEAPYIEVVEGC